MGQKLYYITKPHAQKMGQKLDHKTPRTKDGAKISQNPIFQSIVKISYQMGNYQIKSFAYTFITQGRKDPSYWKI